MPLLTLVQLSAICVMRKGLDVSFLPLDCQERIAETAAFICINNAMLSKCSFDEIRVPAKKYRRYIKKGRFYRLQEKNYWCYLSQNKDAGCGKKWNYGLLWVGKLIFMWGTHDCSLNDYFYIKYTAILKRDIELPRITYTSQKKGAGPISIEMGYWRYGRQILHTEYESYIPSHSSETTRILVNREGYGWVQVRWLRPK